MYFFFFFFVWKSPSLDSLLDHYHILHLQPTVSIFETVVEDLWSVSFLTIWRTGSSLLFFLNLADLYTRSRYHFFVSICSICFLATLLSIIFWVRTEDFIFLYGCKKRPFLFNLGSRNLIWFFTQNPGFWFLLYFIYNSLSYPLPSLWVLLVLVKFSCSLDFSHFEDHPFD